MKKIFVLSAICIVFGIVLGLSGLVFAATATTTGASGQEQCHDTNKTDKYWGEAFRGGSPRSFNSQEVLKENMDLRTKFYEDMAENTEKAANDSSDAMQKMLDQCIAGINMNIFDGVFSGMWDSIVAAVKQKMCNFALQKSSQYINMALDQMQYDLPMGLGSVGANTNVLGYTMSSTGTGSFSQSGAKMSPSVQKDAGYTMFENGGSIMSNQISGRTGFSIPGF